MSIALAAGLTSCQQKALDILERQGNVFLTGAAGTGKSFLLDQYLQNKHSEAFPIVASTGAAAVLVGGRTFHSFFGLGILEGGVEAAIARALRSRKLLNRLNNASCVIIDEISMLSGVTVHAAETVARRARNNELPWGGLRIIAVGDFAQLPPVTPGSMAKDWAFSHPVWALSQFQPALLTTVMRTQDTEFLEILNFVRGGIVNDQVHAFLNGRTFSVAHDIEGTRLYPHRAKADEYNLRRLHAIHGALHSFPTQYEGEERTLDAAKRAIPIPEVLQLKAGALVMMRKNDMTEERRYVNGSLGHIKRIEEQELRITLMNGEEVDVEKQVFSYLDGDGNVAASAWNFPVTLAWATTIHKAQGATLDRMIVDLSALWEPGQAYVALSRVRSGDGLFIERWTPSSIRADASVTALYDAFAEEMKTYVPRPVFVARPITPKIVTRAPKLPGEGTQKERRAALIQALIQKRASLEEIAKACSIKSERVLLYLEEFLESGIELNLSYLLDDLPAAPRIRAAFEEHGTSRLRPVFDALGETIPFTTLRLVRCVMLASLSSPASR